MKHIYFLFGLLLTAMILLETCLAICRLHDSPDPKLDVPGAPSSIDDIKRQTYSLSNDILHKIHMTRHQELFARIDAMSESELVKIKEGLLADFDSNLKKLKTNSNDYENVLAERQRVSKIESGEFRSKLIQKLNDAKKFDTIAVHLSQKDKYLVIAGNIKTRRVDDLSDLRLWRDVVKDDVSVKFRHDEYGFQPNDAVTIENELNEKYNSWSEDNGFDIEIVMPRPDPTKTVEIVRLENSLKQKQETMRSTLQDYDKLINAEKSDPVRLKLIEKRGNVEVQLSNDINKAVDKVQHAKNSLSAQPHAEIQLLKQRDVNPQFQADDAIITPSKPPCAKCESVLKKRISIDFTNGLETYGREGLAGDKVKNWARDFEVLSMTLTDLSEIAHPDKIINTDTNEVNSKKFIADYSSEVDVGRRHKMTADIAESNVMIGRKIIGTPDEVNKFRKIIEYEKMQKHNAIVEYSINSLKTGDFFSDANGKRNGFRVTELLPHTKLSPTRTASAMRLNAEKFAKKTAKLTGPAGKATKVMGKFMLANSIVKGVARGDTTGLGIVGGRVFGESFLQLVGDKFAKKAIKKIGIKGMAAGFTRGFALLGKAASPLGAMADIGLSSWGLSNAISRLNDPNATKFEQNDAIADIVHESLDIAITATVEISSLLLPPLRPLFQVIGFIANLFVTFAVTLYKAHNHVDMLNSKIKLLDFEKFNEFDRYYIVDLIQVKHANNIEVNLTLHILETNPDLIGRVSPSRTFKFQRICSLERKSCSAHFFGCVKWGNHVTMSEKCFGEGGICHNYRYCTDHYDISPNVYDYYTCVCSRKEETVYGYPQPNSKVDLRRKVQVFADRDDPNLIIPSKSELFCAPSSISNKGYKSSHPDRRPGYLCENAIGVRRKDMSGKVMLYELGTGHDQIHLDPKDTTNNYYIVEDGTKHFQGSSGEDTYFLKGPCDSLDGNLNGHYHGGLNTLVINQTCDPGNSILVDLAALKLSSVGRKMDLQVDNIQNLYGRTGESDNIIVSCDTKFVSGGGGKSLNALDTIFISCDRTLDLTIMAAKNTKVNISMVGFGQVFVSVPVDEPGISVFYGSEKLPPETTSARTVFYFKFTAQELIETKLYHNSNNYEIKLDLHYRLGKVELNIYKYAHKPEIVLEEKYGLNANIIITKESGAVVSHRLAYFEGSSDMVSWTRMGASRTSNHFQLVGGDWFVYGGHLDDEFILPNFDGSGFQGQIDGRGGVNSLYLNPNLNPNNPKVILDLISGELLITLGVLTTSPLKIRNIQRVLGRPGQTEHVKCHPCETSYIAGEGGSNADDPDLITVTDNYNSMTKYCSYDLTVVASGHTKVCCNVE